MILMHWIPTSCCLHKPCVHRENEWDSLQEPCWKPRYIQISRVYGGNLYHKMSGIHQNGCWVLKKLLERDRERERGSVCVCVYLTYVWSLPMRHIDVKYKCQCPLKSIKGQDSTWYGVVWVIHQEWKEKRSWMDEVGDKYCKWKWEGSLVFVACLHEINGKSMWVSPTDCWSRCTCDNMLRL